MAEQIHRTQLRFMVNRDFLNRISATATERGITLSALMDEILTEHFKK